MGNWPAGYHTGYSSSHVNKRTPLFYRLVQPVHSEAAGNYYNGNSGPVYNTVLPGSLAIGKKRHNEKADDHYLHLTGYRIHSCYALYNLFTGNSLVNVNLGTLMEITITKRHLKVFLCLALPVFLVSIAGCMGVRMKKYIYSNHSELPGTYTALVPGALVHKNGKPSDVLEDRLLKAAELYEKGIVKRVLLSGDHGSKKYNEVGHMRKYLVSKGVKSNDIFLDHAGFNTYNTIVRAKKIFRVTNVIIVTQDFHLPRSLYIARKCDMDAYGYRADMNRYPGIKYYKFREYFARIKSFFEVLFHLKPRYLGTEVPITGDSKLSW